MSDKKQKIRTVIIPESGLILEPEHVLESEVATDFIRSLAHIVGQSPSGSVILRCSTAGDLRVATVGTAFELYEVENGNAPDAYDAPNTFQYADAVYMTDCLIETFGATISFRDEGGLWGDGKALPVGFYSFDFLHYGIRIQNRVALSVCVYEFTIYR